MTFSLSKRGLRASPPNPLQINLRGGYLSVIKRSQPLSLSNKKRVVSYNTNEEPIVLSKALIDTLLRFQNPSDLIALYNFYYYTAKWQQTNQPKAVTAYVAKALHWSNRKVRKTKQKLVKLGLVNDVIRRTENNSRIAEHYIKINFLWKNTIPTKYYTVVMDPTNALSSNRENKGFKQKAEKVSKMAFLESFPKEWVKRREFRRSAVNFYLHRREVGKRGLTPRAIKMLSKKLIRFKMREVIDAFDLSVANGYIGVFPKSNGISKVATATKQIPPKMVLKQHFESDAKSWIQNCYLPALHLVGKENAYQLSKQLCHTASWYDKKQRRPIYKKIPKLSDPLFTDYSRWTNVIPGSKSFIKKYIEWLKDQTWLDQIQTNMFQPESKVFQKFLKILQKSAGCDFFTGRSLNR